MKKGMMERRRQGRNERMQNSKNNNKQRPVCERLWTGFLLFVDNSSSSTLFTRHTAWHRLLHMAFAKNVLAGDGQNKR